MLDEIRVSPDGRDVAIRNLREVNPRYDGKHCEWRATNGAYLTDKQVEGWIPLNRPRYVNLVTVGEYEDAQTIAVFDANPDAEFGANSDADRFIEQHNAFAENKASISGSAMFYPRGSRD